MVCHEVLVPHFDPFGARSRRSYGTILENRPMPWRDKLPSCRSGFDRRLHGSAPSFRGAGSQARLVGATPMSALASSHEVFALTGASVHLGGTTRGDCRDRPLGGDVASCLGLCEGESWIHPLPSQLEAIGIGLSDLCTRSPGCPPSPISLGDHQYLVSIIGYRPRIAIFNISLPNISTLFLDQLAANVRSLGRSSRGPPERPSSGIPPE